MKKYIIVLLCLVLITGCHKNVAQNDQTDVNNLAENNSDTSTQEDTVNTEIDSEVTPEKDVTVDPIQMDEETSNNEEECIPLIPIVGTEKYCINATKGQIINIEDNALISAIPENLLYNLASEIDSQGIQKVYSDMIFCRYLNNCFVIITDKYKAGYDIQGDQWYELYNRYNNDTWGQPRNWNSRSYIRDEYTNNEEVYTGDLKDSEKLFVFGALDYLTESLFGKNYMIRDGFEINESQFFIEYNSSHLFKVTDSSVEEVIDAPIVAFDYTNEYIAYTTQDINNGVYIYEFLTGDKFYLDQFVAKHVKINGKILVVQEYNDTLTVVRLDDLTGFEVAAPLRIADIEMLSGETIEKIDYCDVLGERIFIKVEALRYDTEYNVDIPFETLIILSQKDMQIYDTFDMREFAISDNNRMFFSNLGMLFEYMPDSKKVRLMDNGYSIYIHTMGNQVAAYQGIDGPGEYKVFNMDCDYVTETFPKGLSEEYILFSDTNEYGSRLKLYDYKEKQFYLIMSSDTTILYKVNEASVEYAIEQRETNTGSTDEDKLEWKTFDLPHAGSVYVKNNQIESVLSSINDQIELGYIFENEVYSENKGEFMIYTSALYNEGLFDKKALVAYRFGSHQKGYEYWYDEAFVVARDVKIDTLVPNKDKTRFYATYTEKGSKKVALFRLLEKEHKTKLVSIYPLTGNVSFDEEGINLVIK